MEDNYSKWVYIPLSMSRLKLTTSLPPSVKCMLLDDVAFAKTEAILAPILLALNIAAFSLLVVNVHTGKLTAGSKHEPVADAYGQRRWECQYLHRLPPPAEELPETSKDCFGRDKFSDYRDDMGGVGSFLKQNRTIYIGRIKESGPGHETEEVVRRHFKEWGEIERSKFERQKSWVQPTKVLCSSCPSGSECSIRDVCSRIGRTIRKRGNGMPEFGQR